jgi:hypothetical protein
MTLRFQSTVPEDLEAISTLLLDGFKAEPDAPFVDLRLLRWKYFESGPRWEGSRGYVLRKNNGIQAHCGIWPIDLHFSDQKVTCLCFVDWVSDRHLPGAGFLLKKKLLALADTAIVVGGTHDTQAVIPRLGFEPVGEASYFVRIVRPWRQFRTRPSEGLSRDAARLARNTAWTRATVAATIPKGWSAVPVESFAGVVPEEGSESEHPTPWRGAEYLDYWLRAPTVEVSGFAIKEQDKIRGYFLLSRVGGQTRVADMRLSSTKQEDWNVAYSLAGKAAADDPETCEVVAVASTLFSEIALHTSGFRQRGNSPLYLYDPRKKLRDAPSIFWNLIDGDAAYIHDPAHPYTS